MRRLSVVTLVLAGAGCTVRVPPPPGLRIAVQARVTVHADATVAATAPAVAVAVAPPAPPTPVPIQGAAVVEFFGIPLEGADEVIFVLDRSSSMDELAHGQLAELAAPPLDAIFFDDELEGLAPAMVPLDEAGRDGVIGFVRDAAPSGATALAPAMRIAFLMNARRIVLLSDGLGNVGGDSRALLRDVREAIRGGVRIDTVGIGNGQDAGLLQALAAESGGLYQAL